LGKYNAQLMGVFGPFMIELGKTRAETLVVVGLSAAFTVVGLSVGGLSVGGLSVGGLSVGVFTVGLTVGLSVVGLTVGGLSVVGLTTGISNISFFGSFNNFLV
jgi:hypothetical protein